MGLPAGVAKNLEKLWTAKNVSKETMQGDDLYNNGTMTYSAETWTLKQEHNRN